MMIVLIVGLIFPIQSPPPTKSLNVRMVQPNIGNNMKLSAEQGVPNSIYEVFDRYKKLSLMPSSKPIDIIIWPETAYPTLLSSAQMQLDPMAIPQVIREVIESSQAPLIFGGYDDHASNDDWFMSEYNTAFLITAKKEIEHYHKVKLIPFGEGLPFGPLNPYLGSIIRNISFFAQGEKAVVFEKTPVPMLPIICYEVLFSDLVRHFLNSTNNKAQILVNLTNDSWYGDTSEPKQHLYLAKWRALEFQIPLIRSTNTGITSIIFPNGSESTSLSFGSINHLDIEVNLGAPKTTFYWRWGIWPSLILWMCVILLLAKFDSILLNAFQNPLSKDHVI
jgi:apolipoprotein N-acyltransferase